MGAKYSKRIAPMRLSNPPDAHAHQDIEPIGTATIWNTTNWLVAKTIKLNTNDQAAEIFVSKHLDKRWASVPLREVRPAHITGRRPYQLSCLEYVR